MRRKLYSKAWDGFGSASIPIDVTFFIIVVQMWTDEGGEKIVRI